MHYETRSTRSTDRTRIRGTTDRGGEPGRGCDVSTGTVRVDQGRIAKSIDLAMRNVSLPKIKEMFDDGSQQLRIYDKDGSLQIITRLYTKQLFSELRDALSQKESMLNTRSNSDRRINQKILKIWGKIKGDCGYKQTNDVVSYLAGDKYRVIIQKNGGRLIERIELGADGEPVSKFEYIARNGNAFRGNEADAERELIMESQKGGQFFKYSRSGEDDEPVTVMFEYVVAPKSRTVGVETRKDNLIISMENAELSKDNALDYSAPDTTEIRSLPVMDGASFCHCTIPSGISSLAGRHPKVEEVWYCLSGQCEIWRNGDKYNNVVTAVSSGHHIKLPPRTRFQVRNQSGEPVYFLIVTVPPWPGNDAWEAVRPRWKQTGITLRSSS